jgi:1,4-alpha-glucan branching enzyme
MPPAKKLSKPAVRDIAFAVRFDQAREVVVTGDFTAWSREGLRLTSGGSGNWGTTLKLVPGEYQYRLIVDGEWRDDPSAPKRVPNPFGSENGVLTVA